MSKSAVTLKSELIAFVKALVVIAAVMIGFAFVFWQKPWLRRTLQGSATHVVDQAIERVKQELETLPKDEWAGRYYQGDGLGANLSLYLAPSSGFAYQWHGCVGLYDQNCGDVSVVNGNIRLSPRYPNKQGQSIGIATDLIPVRWGTRMYLIAPDEMTQFCKDVNLGREPRRDMHGLVFLRWDDWRKEVTGVPSVPAAYAKDLIQQPVLLQVSAVAATTSGIGSGDVKTRRTRVTLDAGHNKRIENHIPLEFIEPNDGGEVSVYWVGRHTCEAVIEQVDREDLPLPQVGWKLRTATPRVMSE